MVTGDLRINKTMRAVSKEMALIQIAAIYPDCRIYSIKTMDSYLKTKSEVITVDFQTKKVLARA